jgi:hypothetical protein
MLLFCDENGLTLPNACSFSSTNIIGAWRQIMSTFGARGHQHRENSLNVKCKLTQLWNLETPNGPTTVRILPNHTDISLQKMGVTGAYIHAVLGLEGREGGERVVVVARETAHGKGRGQRAMRVGPAVGLLRPQGLHRLRLALDTQPLDRVAVDDRLLRKLETRHAQDSREARESWRADTG